MPSPGQPASDLTVDVAVIGGGLGGVAAALAAAEAGCTVVLTEELSRLGGQMTSQLVPALDEHEHIETFAPASYARLRAGIRALAGGTNPGAGWVRRLCFEPDVAERVLRAMLAPHQEQGRLQVLTGHHLVAVQVEDDRICQVRLAGSGAGRDVTVRAGMYCDATDLGDLLELAGAPWVTGSEGQDAYGEPHALPGGPRPTATQSITWCFAVQHLPGQDHTAPRPPGYEQSRQRQPFSLEIEGWAGDVHSYRMFTDGPTGCPPFWSYRRIRRGADVDLAGSGDVAVINWVGNDYFGASLVHEPVRARREARELSAAFLHWLQTEAPRDGGTGRGFPGLRLCPQVTGTPDGFAEAPYVRESRRLCIPRPVTYHDLQPARPGEARAVAVPDSVGTAWYAADLHPRVGAPGVVYAPTAPFQIPLRALIAPRPHNLLAAAKNLGATQVAAAAFRVHAGEWSVGEASGAVAAYCVGAGTEPRQVVASKARLTALQRALLGRGIPLAWLTDVPPGAPIFSDAHLLAVHGGLAGPRLERLQVDPDSGLGEDEHRALLVAAHAVSAPAPPMRQPLTKARSWKAAVEEIATAPALFAMSSQPQEER
ncbi:MAG: FAD-dependent oxidoreductase [Dermatophilaceae bacterium]|nr:FAD-dependent oxidoreductase [Dermatophilaceae bacterium]